MIYYRVNECRAYTSIYLKYMHDRMKEGSSKKQRV